MPKATTTETRYRRLDSMGLDTLYVQIPGELKKLLGEAADTAGMSLNECLAKILSEKFSRPDLAIIHRNRPGRRRKTVAVPA